MITPAIENSPTMNQPLPQSPDKRARFWDRIAAKYARTPVADEAAYQRKLQETQEYLNPDMNVLEIGCGTGTTAIHHAPLVRHIHATDISAGMLDIARDKARDAGVDNVTFAQAGVDELNLPDGSMDMVMAHSILHLVEDPDATVRDMYRLLKNDGVFVSSTACLGDSYQRLLGLVLPLGRWFGWLPLVKVFSERQLLDMLRKAGFEIERHWRPSATSAVFIIARKPKAT